MQRKVVLTPAAGDAEKRKPVIPWVPLTVTAIALLARLPHLAWGLPDVDEEALPMKKALAMWGWADGHVHLDPETAGWPSLSFYMQLLLQHLQYGAGRLVGTFADRNDYFVTTWLDSSALLLLARATSVAAAVAVVWVGAKLAERLAGWEAALLCGGLLALSPLLVQYSQLVTPDIVMAMFVALAIARMIELHQRGQTADYVWTGVWIGLGTSCKYTAVLLLPGVFATHVLRVRRAGTPTRKAPLDGRPWLSFLAALAAFAATSPYLVLHLGTLARDVSAQTVHMTSGHFGVEAAASPLRYLTTVLAPGLGVTGLALSVAGLTWAALRVRGPWLVLTLCLIPYYVGLALLKTQFPRYMLPLLMPIAEGLGGVVLVTRSAHRLGPAARKVTLGLLALIALAPAAAGTLRYHAEQALPSTYGLAEEFLRGALAHGKPHTIIEVLSVTLPNRRQTETLDERLVARLSPPQRSRVLDRLVYDIDYLPMYTVGPERSAFYYDLRHLANYDFVVVSDAVRERYSADTSRFATQARFYKDLDRYGRLVRRFGGDRRTRGPEIRIYQLTPDSAAALVRDRGALPLEAARDSARPLHAPDYMEFVEGVARAALDRGDWAAAARYYRALWEEGVRGGMGREQLDALERLVTQLQARAASAAVRGVPASPRERN